MKINSYTILNSIQTKIAVPFCAYQQLIHKNAAMTPVNFKETVDAQKCIFKKISSICLNGRHLLWCFMTYMVVYCILKIWKRGFISFFNIYKCVLGGPYLLDINRSRNILWTCIWFRHLNRRDSAREPPDVTNDSSLSLSARDFVHLNTFPRGQSLNVSRHTHANGTCMTQTDLI